MKSVMIGAQKNFSFRVFQTFRLEMLNLYGKNILILRKHTWKCLGIKGFKLMKESCVFCIISIFAMVYKFEIISKEKK